MTILCLGFGFPLYQCHRSTGELAVDWAPSKVRMKALVGDKKGDVKGKEMKRHKETAGKH